MSGALRALVSAHGIALGHDHVSGRGYDASEVTCRADPHVTEFVSALAAQRPTR